MVGANCVAAVMVRVQGRKRWENVFTAGSCQCGESRMGAGDSKDLCLLASCDGTGGKSVIQGSVKVAGMVWI